MRLHQGGEPHLYRPVPSHGPKDLNEPGPLSKSIHLAINLCLLLHFMAMDWIRSIVCHQEEAVQGWTRCWRITVRGLEQHEDSR
jgi:hypothetical protein